jgi:hypothetical protein
MPTYEWHGGDTVVRIDDAPERWVVTWGLDVVRVQARGEDEEFDRALSAPDVDSFRSTLATDLAALFNGN